jgi:Protein of unknown function (DUF3306)
VSETDQGFLSRWSRRKRQGEESPAAEPPAPSDTEPQEAGERSQPLVGVDTEREIEPSLPRIEDLTAESDLSVFMRAGVPRELQKAALRRAWSLDPAIRDYCGPADYALNFNDPDSLPGFASKEMVELAKELLDELAQAEQSPKPDTHPAEQTSPQTKEEAD